MPLWEIPAGQLGEDEGNSATDEDAEEDDDAEGGRRNKNELSDDQKKTRLCYGEGMYFIVPSFYRTLMFLHK